MSTRTIKLAFGGTETLKLVGALAYVDPGMKTGNCLLHSLTFRRLNPGSRIRITFRNRHVLLPTFYCVMEDITGDVYRFGYRSRPRGNGNKLWFHGKIQVTRKRNNMI